MARAAVPPGGVDGGARAVLGRFVLEAVIVSVLCGWSGYAVLKRGPAERAVAIFLLCAIELSMTRNLAFALPLCVCCGYALWHGGAPERIAAATMFFAVILTHYAWSAWATRLTSVEVGILAVDIAALIVWIGVALYAERFWPIWFTALHAIAVTGHAVKMVDPDLPRWGYAFAIVFWSYPMLPMLALATWCHRRRLARRGIDPDWSPQVRRAVLVPAQGAG
ncbi:MAG TPA: hypothetical protein VF702_01220 [Allosphingosinicella sp.]